MAEADFEKLGVFYLGKRYDFAEKRTTDELFLYDSKDLVTHAVCIGMTGSGKTGLCLSLIEEAAIDGIPVIAIDPKGDLSNLLLSFPNLATADFLPWVDADQATRAGTSVEQHAEQEALKWKNGLAQWGQDGERIMRLRTTADFAVYTPGSSAGIPISILQSFAAPPPAVLEESDLLRERIQSTVSSLLALLGVEGDPLRSREHILLSTIIKNCWDDGKDVSLASLIQLIQKPPFAQIGALDLEAFYPVKERFELAMMLNNLLASPGFEVWTKGAKLDINELLYSSQGKPKVSILSIAHLGDAERMFFVSLLLNQMVTWMRSQSGTSSLRAILYMDEIFGYFPPTANPPSKTPLLTLLKQARAFGLGVLLATQNPVDIDYKGLSNAGTWFIGRLQTERDKMRLLDGLEGAASSAGGDKFDRSEMDKILSSLSSRVFLMNNVHDDGPIIFQTRWTLSYLRGPLTREQLKVLSTQTKIERSPSGTDHRAGLSAPEESSTAKREVASAAPPIEGTRRVILPPTIKEFFLPIRITPGEGMHLCYRPFLLGIGNVRFSDTKASLDTTLQYSALVKTSDSMHAIDWAAAPSAKVWAEDLKSEPEDGAQFLALPAGFSDPKLYAAWSKEFAASLYSAKKLRVFKSSVTGMHSKPRESERDFRIRLAQVAREQRDKASEALRVKFAPKLAALEERLARAHGQVERQQAQLREQQMQSAISVGATVLGAFMGRRRGSLSVSRAASAARTAGRAAREQQDVSSAQDSVERVESQLDSLNAQFASEMSALEGKFDPNSTELEEVSITPKKTNVSVTLFSLAWAPFFVRADGAETPGWMREAAGL